MRCVVVVCASLLIAVVALVAPAAAHAPAPRGRWQPSPPAQRQPTQPAVSYDVDTLVEVDAVVTDEEGIPLDRFRCLVPQEALSGLGLDVPSGRVYLDEAYAGSCSSRMASGGSGSGIQWVG